MERFGTGWSCRSHRGSTPLGAPLLTATIAWSADPTPALEKLSAFLAACVPSPLTVVLVGPLALLWSIGAIWFAGILKHHRQWQTGYSRKVFHLLVFAAASIAQLVGGLSWVCIVGATTTSVLVYALMCG